MDKQCILDEIVRTAKQNGGQALGRQRFLEATGIRESDWLGRYWVKWSDAVKEAGVAPGVMQAAYSDEYVLSNYATLVRELQHLPTTAEVKMKGRSDPDFPSHNTFTRFGSKQHLINQLHAFCVQRPEYQDVAELCSPHVKDVRPEPANEPTPSVEDYGHIYLIKSGRYHKIGRTSSLGRRERELAIQLPERAETIHTIATDDPSGIEAYWHRRFADRRKNGEWFELSAADIKAFCRRKFM